jgi:hypothetical protein
VQSADWNTNLRADRIVALRLWGPGSEDEESTDLCHLEAITADGIADPSRPGVRLCSGGRTGWVEGGLTELLKLIAENIDNRYGGIIDCCDEQTAVDGGFPSLFHFTPFREPPPGSDFFGGGKAAQPRR